MLTGRWVEKIQRLRPLYGDIDALGEREITQWECHPLPAALIAPTGSTEPQAAGEDPTINGLTVYWRGNPGIDVRADDRIALRDNEWEIEGTPQRWPAGTTITLKGVDNVQSHI